MHNKSEMATTLEDLICHHGAPNGLFSNNAKAQCGKRVLDILSLYAIKDFQCEPYQQHQNFAERKIGDTKRLTDSTIMDRTGTPAKLWLLCLLYVVFLMNHLASSSLDGVTPMEKATGQRLDTSPLLNFHWYEPVLYADEAHSFPSESYEKSGCWVGIAKTKGDTLTYQILTDDTAQLITCSAVRKRHDANNPNLRVPSGSGEPANPILFSASNLSGLDIDPPNLKLLTSALTTFLASPSSGTWMMDENFVLPWLARLWITMPPITSGSNSNVPWTA
jgi:hypothetical protein